MIDRRDLISEIKNLLDPKPKFYKGFVQKPDGKWYDLTVEGPGMTKEQCLKTYARGHLFIIPASKASKENSLLNTQL